MRTAWFDYELPDVLIAQHPAVPRDSSRLMVVGDEGIKHLRFSDITNILGKDDLLILNNTRVIPARVRGRKDTGGAMEFLFLERNDDLWTALVKGKPRPGATGDLGSSGVRFELIENDGNSWTLRTDPPVDQAMLAEIGETPLPPYIRTMSDLDNYQTVYAEHEGSVAAPTAGLHFTPELLDALAGDGVSIRYLTLHIGPGTFMPVKGGIEEHVMEPERYSVPPGIWDEIENAGRVICVGTSTIRTLESARASGSDQGMADVFIHPGYKFRNPIDMFLTNFHLPRSTPLLLVTAFGGSGRIWSAYEEAIEKRYRFYSFGDAMLVTRVPMLQQ